MPNSAPWTRTTLYAAVGFGVGSGEYASTDGGGSWNPFNAGLPNAYIDALAIDHRTPSALYAGTNGVACLSSHHFLDHQPGLAMTALPARSGTTIWRTAIGVWIAQ